MLLAEASPVLFAAANVIKKDKCHIDWFKTVFKRKRRNDNHLKNITEETVLIGY